MEISFYVEPEHIQWLGCLLYVIVGFVTGRQVAFYLWKYTGDEPGALFLGFIVVLLWPAVWFFGLSLLMVRVLMWGVFKE